MMRLPIAWFAFVFSVGLTGPVFASQVDPTQMDPTQVESGAIEVDMQLVLAVDISFSISTDEQGVQRRGYIEAFRDPDVIRAITSGSRGRIAVTMVEWAGASTQTQIVPWTMIWDPQSAADFADRLSAAPVQRSGRTSISEALQVSLQVLEISPFVSFRRVVDISSDGLNNSGRRVDRVRDLLLYHGVVINGLPLLTGSETGPAENLDVYFADCVTGGPGSFVEPVRAWSEFGAALKKKLILEIAGAPQQAPRAFRFARHSTRSDDRPPALQPQVHKAADAVPGAMDCLTGEKEDLRNYIDQLKKTTGDRAPRWIPREEDWPMPD